MKTMLDYLRDLRKQNCTIYVPETGIMTLIRALNAERIHEVRIVSVGGESSEYRVDFRGSERQWNSVQAYLRGANVTCKTASKDQFGRIYYREL